MKKLILTGFISLLLAGITSAQWECPSQLAASLKPLGKTPVYWSGELTLGGGYLEKNWIGNSMAIAGIDWSTDKSSFYAEGGVKYWNRYDFNTSQDYYNSHIGLRELYYQYKTGQSIMTFGIQSAHLDDDFLLNERIMGTNLKFNSGKFGFNIVGGSVSKNFARNGTFCNVGYIYDILPDRQRVLLGNTFGQTNLGAVTIKYQPHKVSEKKHSDSLEDEFSSAEFGESLEQPSESKKSSFRIDAFGAVVYREFGSWIKTPFLTSGLFAQTEWGNGWSFKPEFLFQAATGNRAFIYSLKLEKIINSEKTRTNLNLRFLGKTNIDNGALALNSFSNIFAGDVIRLDAIDMPFMQAGIKRSFPQHKLHFKAQFASQLNGNELKEFDLEAGKKLGKKLQLNLISGYVKSSLLSDNALMGRVEFRYYF